MSLEIIKVILETIGFIGLLLLTIAFLLFYYPAKYYLGLAGFWTVRAMYNILTGQGIICMCVDIFVIACYLWMHYHEKNDDDNDESVVELEVKKDEKELVHTI